MGDSPATRFQFIYDSKFGHVSRTIRFPLGYGDKRGLAIREFLDFRSTWGCGPITVGLTCNVVLRGESENADTYSVFYGQSFSNFRSGNHTYDLDGPHRVDDVTDFVEAINLDIGEGEVAEAFETRKIQVGLRSGTSVHEVISIVLIFETYLEKTKIKSGESCAARR